MLKVFTLTIYLFFKEKRRNIEDFTSNLGFLHALLFLFCLVTSSKGNYILNFVKQQQQQSSSSLFLLTYI